MHKTEKRAKESRMNLMYSYLCDRTLELDGMSGRNFVEVDCMAHSVVAGHQAQAGSGILVPAGS